MPDILLVLPPSMGGPRTDAEVDDQAGAQMKSGHLVWLARHARRLSLPLSDTDVLSLLGLPPDAPTGPLSALGAGLDAGQGHWCLARPLHLRADLSTLLLFGPASLAMSAAEAQALAEAFNAHFDDRGIRLYPRAGQGWLLRSETPLGPGLGPVERANPDLRGLGQEARPWQGLLMETQMLFHGHEVNAERQRQQRPMINGLWPEGCGSLPALEAGEPHKAAWVTSLVAESDWAKGLAMHSGLPLAPLDSHMNQGQLWLLSEDRDVASVLERALSWQTSARGREVWVGWQGAGWRLERPGWLARLVGFWSV